MPRHDPSKTPPELRRAEKGDTVARFGGFHTAESYADFVALREEWKLSHSETIRKALRKAVETVKPTTRTP